MKSVRDRAAGRNVYLTPVVSAAEVRAAGLPPGRYSRIDYPSGRRRYVICPPSGSKSATALRCFLGNVFAPEPR